MTTDERKMERQSIIEEICDRAGTSDANVAVLIAAAEIIEELRHTIHTKIPALETAMVLQSHRIAEYAMRLGREL